jgi:hypothetical protein
MQKIAVQPGRVVRPNISLLLHKIKPHGALDVLWDEILDERGGYIIG